MRARWNKLSAERRPSDEETRNTAAGVVGSYVEEPFWVWHLNFSGVISVVMTMPQRELFLRIAPPV
jgi:hypothetical protein